MVGGRGKKKKRQIREVWRGSMSPNRGIGGPMARQLSARAMGENRSGMPGEPLGKERKREREGKS